MDIGADYSSMWSPVGGVVSEPSAVAIDPSGRAVSFGLEAVLSAGRHGSHLVVEKPFSLDRAHDAALAETYLRWLVGKAGFTSVDDVAVFLPIHADPAADAGVSGLVSTLGGDPVAMHRPIAAAIALDVAAGPVSSHLMVELGDDRTEIAVVRSGLVARSEMVEAGDARVVASAIHRMLHGLEAFEEIEIRAMGMHVYGWSAQQHALDLAGLADLSLASQVGSGSTVLRGARLLAESTLLWLAGPPGRD